jgi:outer membrane lipoprotein-sorting protein
MIMPLRFLIFIATIGFLMQTPILYAAPDLQIVEKWLQSNANTRTLKVEFTQTRSLKAIKSPLSQTGILWLDYATSRFRWQLGDPPKTIVVRLGEKIAIMRTPLKRVEYREAGQSGSGQQSAGFSGLTGGFPKTMGEFQKKYQILSTNPKGNAHEIVTQPLGADAEGVNQFIFVVDQERFLLKGLIIELKDGSTITTTFQRVDRNLEIAEDLFNPDLSEYTETKFTQG